MQWLHIDVVFYASSATSSTPPPGIVDHFAGDDGEAATPAGESAATKSARERARELQERLRAKRVEEEKEKVPPHQGVVVGLKPRGGWVASNFTRTKECAILM